ncbi:MAG: AAA family ATPase, partial [Candidatus Thorarchaeota archaeon]
MILQSLTARNFKLLQLDDLELNEGVTLIRGHNESGKSTIMEAILYALFGYVLRPKMRPPKGRMIEHNANKAVVSLDFTVAKKDYRVVREIFRQDSKSNRARLGRLYSDGRTKDIETSVKGVNKKIENLLGGITYHEMVSSCIVAQKELGKLIEQEPKQREKIINIFLNLHDFNAVESLASDRRKQIQPIRGRGGILPGEKQALEFLETDLEEFNGKKALHSKKKSERTSTEKEMNKIQKKYDKCNGILSELEEYEAIHNKRSEIETKREGLEKELGSLNEWLENLSDKEDRAKKLRQGLSHFSYLDGLESEIEAIEELTDKMKQTHTRKRMIEEGVEEKGIELSEAKKERDLLAPTDSELNILDASEPDRMILRGLGISTVLFLILGIAVTPFLLLLALVFGIILGYFLLKRVNIIARKAEVQKKHVKYLAKSDLAESAAQKYEEMVLKLDNEKEEETSTSKSIQSMIDKLPEAVQPLKEEMEIISQWQHIQETYTSLKEERAGLRSELEGIEGDVEKKPEIEAKVGRVEGEIKDCSDELGILKLPELSDGLVFSIDKLADSRTQVKSLNGELSELRERLRGLDKDIQDIGEFLEMKADLPNQVKEKRKTVSALEYELEELDII